MMNQRKLYHTIESFAAEIFKTDKELLKHVVNEIVKADSIEVRGGRIWEFDPSSESYRLIHQIGQIQQLEADFRIAVEEYPTFLQVGKQRSVVAKETNRYLRNKGIVRYSATGVGEKVPYRATEVYTYILAFNFENVDQDFLPELGIISVAVTSLLGRRKMEQRARLLAKDIDRAREIQRSILPPPAITFHHYEAYGISIPDRIVGGDFFDYRFGDEDRDRLVIVIGDAASKGLKAAAQAMYLAGGIRMGISYQTKISGLVSRLNELLHQTFSEDQFVSMFYAELVNDRKGLILYVNAGHNSPYIFRADSRALEMLEPTGQILGPFPDQKYGVENTYLNFGDLMVMYTDGISEARNTRGELYGDRRFQEVIVAQAGSTAEDACRAILDDVQKFSKGSSDRDDRTLVAVKRIR